VNYDLPDVPESYVHRIGRTARAGAEGIAISFCSVEEVPLLRAIEKLIRLSIPATDQRTSPRAAHHGSANGAETRNARAVHRGKRRRRKAHASRTQSNSSHQPTAVAFLHRGRSRDQRTPR